MIEVKFCGMTRPEDVLEAARLGARYVGVIMTASPRRVAPDLAVQLRDAIAGTSVRTVGVFGNEPVDEIIPAARAAGVDIIQLHRSGLSEDAGRLRTELGVEVWNVVPVGPDGLGAFDRGTLAGASTILLDTLASGGPLGGTGIAFDWDRAAADATTLRVGRRLVVAGGLRPENVAAVIAKLLPDVVDVSSGVESAPGVKDHQRMAAFMKAVLATHPALHR